MNALFFLTDQFTCNLSWSIGTECYILPKELGLDLCLPKVALWWIPPAKVYLYQRQVQ